MLRLNKKTSRVTSDVYPQVDFHFENYNSIYFSDIWKFVKHNDCMECDCSSLELLVFMRKEDFCDIVNDENHHFTVPCSWWSGSITLDEKRYINSIIIVDFMMVNNSDYYMDCNLTLSDFVGALGLSVVFGNIPDVEYDVEYGYDVCLSYLAKMNAIWLDSGKLLGNSVGFAGSEKSDDEVDFCIALNKYRFPSIYELQDMMQTDKLLKM